MKIKVDMHIHTRYSGDSLLAPEKVIETVRERKLDGVAVTDHNEIKGALSLREMGPFHVIVGEEIKTTEGEIIGYFLSEKVAPNQTPEETIQDIRRQGGLICIPHPFALFRRSKLKHASLMRILSEVDMLETFNARNLYTRDNGMAIKLANEKDLAQTAGSDAHLASEIGNAYIEIETFSNKEDFLENVKKGHCFGRKTSTLAHAVTVFVNIWNRKYF